MWAKRREIATASGSLHRDDRAMRREGTRRIAIDPERRTVRLTERAWKHIRLQHPELAPFEAAIMETVISPLRRSPDVRPGRERYFTEGIGPSRFLRVVISFTGDRGEIVTAFAHRRAR